MEIVVGFVNAALTFGVIAAVGVLMAGLFIMVLALATGIDSNIQQEDEQSS